MNLKQKLNLYLMTVISFIYSQQVFARINNVSVDKATQTIEFIISAGIGLGIAIGVGQLAYLGYQFMTNGYDSMKHRTKDFLIGFGLIIGCYYIGGFLKGLIEASMRA